MHFIKAVVLFAGIAAAAPASSSAAPSSSSSAVVPSSSSKPASSTSVAPSSSSKAASVTPSASSKPASSTLAVVVSSSTKPASSPSSAAPSGIPTALVSAIFTDLENWDTALDNAITALKGFTGGSNIQSQGSAVSAAGDKLDATTKKLITDAQAIKNYGLLSVADSSTYTSLIVDDLADDLISVFNLVQNKKAIFTQAGVNMHDGLVNFANGIQQIGDLVGPHLQSADVSKVQNVGKNIVSAAQSAIAAYA